MSHRQLSTYLNDHLGLATAGTNLARNLAGRDDDYGKAMRKVAAEIAQDREELQDLMRRVGVRRNGPKLALGFVGERLSRIRLNGRFGRQPELSRLEALETLSVGIEGKRSLWRALQVALAGDRRVAGGELDRLVKRAKAQRKRVEALRLRAATESLPEPRS